MKWPWNRSRRTKPEFVIPLPIIPENSSDVFQRRNRDELNLDEQIIATSNVMAIRDAVNVFLVVIKDHREDGHDCPPYCVPNQLAYFLQIMDDDDLRMMLTVVLKDMVENYLQQEQQEEAE